MQPSILKLKTSAKQVVNQGHAMEEILDSCASFDDLFNYLFKDSRSNSYKSQRIWEADGWFKHGVMDDYANHKLNQGLQKVLNRRFKEATNNGDVDFFQVDLRTTTSPCLSALLPSCNFNHGDNSFSASFEPVFIDLWKTTGLTSINLNIIAEVGVSDLSQSDDSEKAKLKEAQLRNAFWKSFASQEKQHFEETARHLFGRLLDAEVQFNYQFKVLHYMTSREH